MLSPGDCVAVGPGFDKSPETKLFEAYLCRVEAGFFQNLAKGPDDQAARNHGMPWKMFGVDRIFRVKMDTALNRIGLPAPLNP